MLGVLGVLRVLRVLEVLRLLGMDVPWATKRILNEVENRHLIPDNLQREGI
ncbi:hypothetical protein [Paenibacillus camerounensis]|uniref:hypothetical protein n=1 Tax=Paenibacillus camerounensis TaxID=1243663 RepID=UPI000B16CB5D|nr:hypothetical protein [Paenibacillus camerounensis]